MKYERKFLKSLSDWVKESNNFKSIDFLELYKIFVKSQGKKLTFFCISKYKISTEDPSDVNLDKFDFNHINLFQ